MKLTWLYFRFRDRLARTGFWVGSIALWCVFAVLTVFLDTTLGRSSSLILLPPFFWMIGALGTKRLHDRGHSGYYWLWLLLPVLGPVLVFVQMAFLRGNPGDNQYGNDPRTRDADYLTVK